MAKAIIPHLFEAQPGPAHANAMFDALVEANAPLVATMGEAFINAALDDERTGPAFADRLLEQKLGEGYTLARVEELVALDREGLIDVESLKEDLGTGREPTARERELETQLTAEKARVKELTGGKEDATRREEQRLADTVETAVTNAVGALVQPLAEKIGWVTKEGATGPHAGVLSRLGKLANAELQAAVKQMPEYDQIQQLVKEGRAFKDGKPTQIMRVKLDAIQRRGLAHFKQTARELRPAISLLAGQNAAAPNDPPPPSTAGRSGDDATTQPPAPAAQRKPQSLDEINAEYDRRMREAREPVGTTRRR